MRKWKAAYDAEAKTIPTFYKGSEEGAEDHVRAGTSESPVLTALGEGKAGHGEEKA